MPPVYPSPWITHASQFVRRHRDIELRAEFARVMTRDFFPADKDAIAARLEDTDAPPDGDRRARLMRREPARR